MAFSSQHFTPYIPSDKQLAQSDLLAKAHQLTIASSKLTGTLPAKTLETISRFMAVINSYYSNLIEGNATKPLDIIAAQHGEYSEQPTQRDLQLESVAHVKTQLWIAQQTIDFPEVLSPAFILATHKEIYGHLPERLYEIRGNTSNTPLLIEPGYWRKSPVQVGMHIPPDAEDLSNLMEAYSRIYTAEHFQGDKRIIAVMAAHHRFSWIHPFLDGNGRVGRLLTDTALSKLPGLESLGVWCLSRGLARSRDIYKQRLALADHTRQGDRDGRGNLTENGLISFCDYMLDTALDQVHYMSECLALPQLKERLDQYVFAREAKRIPSFDEKLHPNTSLILFQAFLQGELPRQQVLSLLGPNERTARRELAKIKKDGLLTETSSRSPLSWGLPIHAVEWYFPNLG